MGHYIPGFFLTTKMYFSIMGAFEQILKHGKKELD